MNPETKLQNQIRIALSKHGKVFRMNSGVLKTVDGRAVRVGAPGMPDLLFLGDKGVTVWLEVKTATGRVTERQARFIDMLDGLGHRCAVVRSVDDAICAIKEEMPID